MAECQQEPGIDTDVSSFVYILEDISGAWYLKCKTHGIEIPLLVLGPEAQAGSKGELRGCWAWLRGEGAAPLVGGRGAHSRPHL